MALKENYKDDILDVSVNTKRKYKMTDNGDGTVSFDDETVYTQEGDSFGASDLNDMAHAINNIATDAEHTSYDNTTSGLQATNVQDAVDEINDNLSGFKFYPTGTGIVGLIADDSAYTDEDGNYVVWGTATANQLVADNPNTYKSVPSTEDTRGEVGADTASPFSTGYKELGMSLATYHGSYALTLQIYNFKNCQLSQDTTTKRLQGEYIELSSANFYVSIKALKKAHYTIYRIKNTDTSATQPLIDGVYDANQNIFTDSGQNYDYTYRYLVFAK